MMVYVPGLDQVQLGAESAWGTSVAATSKLGLVDDVSIDPEISVETLKDIRGSLAPGYVDVLNSHQGGASIQGVMSYEDTPYILDSLLMTATPGAATTYVRDYIGQLTTVPTRSKYTVYKGQSGKVQKLLGGLFTELTVKIETNKPWKYTTKLIGKSVEDGSLASLSDRTQTPIHANTTSVYIDAVGGTIGATLITAILFSADLTVKNGLGLVSHIGSLTPSTYADGMADLSLKMKMAVDTDTAGYLTAILGTSVVQKLIRIKSTTGSSQIAQFDIGATFAKAPKVNTDQDGVVTFDFDMVATYNSTLGNWFKSSVTNSIATMP
jgi:hypothetical protein